MPKILQEPFEHGVYEDILERQAQGVAVEERELKELPALTAADYERLGDTYLRRGQSPLARVKYEKARELAPNTWRLEYKIGSILLHEGAPGEAVEYFRRVEALEPMNARGYEGEGRALLAAGDHEASEVALRKAVELDSGSAKAHEALGVLLDKLGRLDESIVHYEAARKARPRDPSILNNYGVSRYLRRDYDAAIDTFQLALTLTPDREKPRVYNNLGRAYAKAGRYQSAFDSFRKGADAPTAYNNLGLIFLEENRLGKSAACFQRAMDASPRYYGDAAENLAVAMDRLSSESDADAGRSPAQSAACP